MEEPDFSGWASKANLKCTDGRTIADGAFAHQDKMRVPLVWMHGHNDSSNVLGHAILENRPGQGTYCYAYLNKKTPQGTNVAALLEHGDVDTLSIWANQLVEKLIQGGKQVLHGAIREVSVVLAGANPGAKIENVRLVHSDDPDDYELLEDEARIFTGLPLEHESMAGEHTGDETEEGLEHADDTKLREIYDSMTDEQKDLLHTMVGAAIEGKEAGDGGDGGNVEHSGTGEGEGDAEGGDAENDNSNEEGNLEHQEGSNMTRNTFDQNTTLGALAHAIGGLEPEKLNALAHSVFESMGSFESPGMDFKQALLAHAGEYGVTNIEALFPEATNVTQRPEWVTRRMDWVPKVIDPARKLPYSKIKSWSADLTHDEARAKGYIKTHVKKEQFFEIAFRETGPTTIYKKQKLDRDDYIDITSFDIIAWFWEEMRFMLKEELARAILISDGREVDDEDKIKEDKIRPIATDNSFYTDVIDVANNIVGVALVDAVVAGREPYQGAGDPTAFMTRATMNGMLLARDPSTNKRYYRTRADLAEELEVDEIVLVPVMAGAQRDGKDILMILVNMSDYAIGSTKGGEVTTFEDFDIDVNQHKLLIETRCSGALVSPKKAQVVLRAESPASTLTTPAAPTFNNATGVVTIPATTGVIYKNGVTGAVLTAGAQSAIAIGATLVVDADEAPGYHFPEDFDEDWEFTRTA